VSRLKEVRLHGFKSFAEPTRFVFERGVTAVIGPNGSGKSNMADAIRWALGEQSNRSLRTRRSDDVIFAGSESRKPIGMAEVVLTLDNQDGWLPIEFAEVTITRRAYRSGDPEYLINGTKARLRDVTELLAAGRLGANELVVVGQGTVDAALSLRPEERRQLFEEAAGVKAFQVRRNEATAKLGKARDNLTRVSDLVRELKPQVRRLALQAEHQEAHDRLGSQARALVVEHHARRAQGLQSNLGETRRRAAAVGADLDAERAAQATGRQAVSDAEQRYWASEAAGRQATADWEIARETVIRAEGRHDGLVERDLDLAAEIERARRELIELGDETPPAGGATGVSTNASTDGRRAAAAEAEEAWRGAVEAARAADAELLAAEEALAAVRARDADRVAETGRRAEREAVATERRERLEQARTEVVAALAAAEVASTTMKRAREASAEALALAERRWMEASPASTEAADQAARAGAALSEIEERARQTAEELASLSGPENADPDLADHLRSTGWDGLADGLGPVPPDAAQAVTAVLGDLHQALVWRSASALPVERTAGQAQFLRPANGIPAGLQVALTAVDATQTLAQLIGAPAAPELLHRTVVAPSVESLLAGWVDLPDGWAAVTLGGDVADARGIVTIRGRRGPTAPTSPAARRAELASRSEGLATQLAEARARASDAEAARESATRNADAAMAALEAARITHRRADDDAATAEAQVVRLAGEQDRITSELAALPAMESIAPPRTGAEAEVAGLESSAREARGRRDLAGAARDAARERWQAAVAAADEQDAAAADGRAAAARYEVRHAQLRTQVDRLERERETVAATLQDASALLAGAREAEAAASAARAAAEADREAERQALLEAERRLSGDSGRLAELEAAQQAAAIESSRLEEGLASLAREQELALEGLPEQANTAVELAGVEGEEPLDVAGMADDALEEAMRKARRTLHQIGSVNPFAIQEHAELSARLQELTTQETDLRSAVESTESLIARLDEDISQQFQAAFAAIGRKFDEYCQLLFAGGSASLELNEDGDSEAPGGIEIAVRPPGKRLQRLAMLSGGERALAGVALLFAMLTVNPVPFCVLDEVDAALDEANIGRFADALRRLSETIDFVVITHNRATIETADTIYGVTMTDAAVSRVLSLRLADLPVAIEA